MIALGIVLAIVLVVGLANALGGSTSNPPVQAPAEVTDATSDWTTWLDQHYATTPAWVAQITRVRMDVGAWDVVVSTTLSDQTTSLTVCQQASGFALDRGKTSVQVLDSAGLVLASKHTGGVCEWRR